MLEYRKRTFMALTNALLAFLLLQVLINAADAAAKCHKCTGINCQRTTYAATEDCLDALDSCVSVFDGSTVLAQGCLGQLSSELRNKCEMSTVESADPDQAAIDDDGEALPTTNRQCYQCREDLCNNVSADGFECVQCDSDVNGKCASDTENLPTEKCPIGKAVNSYCYTKLTGKHATRGCAVDLVQQKECLNSDDCVLCTPTDISGCNREPKVAADDNGSDAGGSGGSDSGTGDGSNSGGSGGGSGGGGSNSGGNGGTDSGTGSGSGSSSGGSGGSDSGSGGGGSNSGGGGDSGTSAGGGGSNSGSSGGSDSGTAGGGSNSGGSGGSDSGSGGNGGSNTGTGGDNSGADNENGGSNNGTDSGSGNDSSDSDNNNNNSAAIKVSSKLSITAILFMLSYFI